MVDAREDIARPHEDLRRMGKWAVERLGHGKMYLENVIQYQIILL